MELLHSPKQYLFNLHTTSSSEAKRLWRKQIREKWKYKCAYCGSEENLTIDHVLPQSRGGKDVTENMICCCHSCNQSKGHTPWEEWYFSQEFFSLEKYFNIKEWIAFV
jgi:5-methylcytosine-specific restriction endonuclease McrA